MNLIYIVHAEENTFVFKTQVLDYLKSINSKISITLVIFANYRNFFKIETLKNELKHLPFKVIVFRSLPSITKLFLNYDSYRFKKYILKNNYSKDNTILHCRGEIAAYIAIKSTSNYKVLFDNRGLAVEEIESRQKFIFKNKYKYIRKYALNYAGLWSSAYSFVTSNLRNIMINKYMFDNSKRYIIVPTLVQTRDLNEGIMLNVKNSIDYNENFIYMIYTGSSSNWQNYDQIFSVFYKLKKTIDNLKLIILSDKKISVNNKFVEDIYQYYVGSDIVKYYLSLAKLGIIVRKDDLINFVAAPTKLSEYISYNLTVLYEGKIGSLYDIGYYNDEIFNKIYDISELNSEKIKNIILSVENNFSDNLINYFSYNYNIKKIIKFYGELLDCE